MAFGVVFGMVVVWVPKFKSSPRFVGCAPVVMSFLVQGGLIHFKIAFESGTGQVRRLSTEKEGVVGKS